MKAGFARTDITPPLGSVIPGQLHKRFAKRILDPCTVTAMVLDDGEKQVAITSADIALLVPEDVAEIRALVSDATGIPDTHVMVHTTHTHTGPQTQSIFWCHPDQDMVGLIKRQTAAAVLLAQRDLKEAELCFGQATLPGVAFNRRWVMRDGTQSMHPAKGHPDLVREAGIVDETLGAIGVWRGENELAGAMVNFGSHPICVGNEDAISADYCGHVRRAVEGIYPGSLSLYANAPCGDTCQFNVRDTSVYEYGEYWSRRLGSIIGAASCRLLEEAPREKDLRLAVDSRIVTVPIRKPTPERLAEAHTIVENPEGYDELTKAYAAELLELVREVEMAPNALIEVHVIWIGDNAIVGLPGEFFSEYAQVIRQGSQAEKTFVVELANGWHGYVPTPSAFGGGGYETWLARSSKLEPEAGAMVTECAVGMLRRRK